MRYWSGETPIRRTKLRRIVSAVPKPQRAAITVTVSSVSSSCRARGLGADPFDVGPGRLADLVGEHPGEMPRAHGGAAGEIGDAVRRTGFGLDRLLHFADRRPLGPGHPHRCGELALPAGPPQVQHEVARDRLRHLGAVILLDQRQRQVDTRR